MQTVRYQDVKTTERDIKTWMYLRSNSWFLRSQAERTWKLNGTRRKKKNTLLSVFMYVKAKAQWHIHALKGSSETVQVTEYFFQTVLLHKFSFRQKYAKSQSPPSVCAQPSGGRVSIFPPPALGSCSRQSHNFKVKTEERCDTHTHTRTRAYRLHTLQGLSVLVFPHFLLCHPVGLFRPLWCIIEAVCNFHRLVSNRIPLGAELSLLLIVPEYSLWSGKGRLFEHAG